MNGRRFTVVYSADNTARLMDRDREVMTGPDEELRIFARWLNEDPPPTLDRLRERVQACIMVSRGCSFGPGPGLKEGQP